MKQNGNFHQSKPRRTRYEYNNQDIFNLVHCIIFFSKKVDIVFKVNKIHFNAVTFKCIGYDKRKMNNAIIGNRIREIPEKQIFTLPNQVFIIFF